MHPSALALRAASLSPRLTAIAMKLVAPRVPPSWVINAIVTRYNIRIPVRAKLDNGMTAWVLLGDEVGEGIRRRGYTERETLKTIVSHLGR